MDIPFHLIDRPQWSISRRMADQVVHIFLRTCQELAIFSRVYTQTDFLYSQ